jgi:putative nucleotidyltransferase with HDIG domain
MGASAAALGRNRAFLKSAALWSLAGGLIACVGLAGWQTRIDRADTNGLIVVLGVAAVVSGWLVVPLSGRASVSASFIVVLLAAAFLGPASACAVALLAEFSAALKRHSRPLTVAYNALGVLAPALAAANLIRLPGGVSTGSAGFYLLVAGAGVLYLTLNFAIVASYIQVLRGQKSLTLQVFREFAPPQALNVALAVAGAAIYVRVGLAGIAFALTAVFGFSYQAQLLERSRHRSQQYVSLSWGVLAGLMRSLNVRDGRAARHAAAVARFARDMADAVGMSAQQQELAHTAGLLHDIGHFALSDRVAERGKVLQEEDWVAIQRHPELGAEMLKDLGMYGPVAEIVLAHHERIDGRGYPNGLAGEEIPEIAKMIAVAEVYDTLTASDTYRTRMSSFEALRELRRVAGTQLESRYVEVLVNLLSGEGTEYRHADAADFDVELAMERRIKEARG